MLSTNSNGCGCGCSVVVNYSRLISGWADIGAHTCTHAQSLLTNAHKNGIIRFQNHLEPQDGAEREDQTPGFRLGIHKAMCDVTMTQSIFMCSQWSELLLLLLPLPNLDSECCKIWQR